MQTLASVKTDAQGQFQFDKEDMRAPHLIQALYQGVHIHKPSPAGNAATGMQVDVFDSTTRAGIAKVSQHFIVLQPGPSEMTVSEGRPVSRRSEAYLQRSGQWSVRFYLPPKPRGQVSVTINAPGGMPIQRPAEKTNEAECV